MTLARRSVLLVLALLSLLLPLRSPAPIDAQEADTIIIGTTDLPRSLDPADAYDFAAWEVLSHLYTGLTRQIPGTFDYELALASDVDISADGLTYTFVLREDAAFADGTPITAQDFVTSIERVIALNRPAASAVTPYVAGVEADADGRLVFTLARPVPYFLALLALPPYYAQHPSLAQQAQPDPFLREGLIGSGPYRLEDYAPGQSITLVADADYAFGPAPQNARVILRQHAYARDLRAALRQREVDVAWRALSKTDFDALDGIAGLAQHSVPSTRAYYLVMNQELEPTDDPLVREAMVRLLEREEAVEQVFGGQMTALTSLVPPLFAEAYTPLWPDAPDAPAAEEALTAAAYSARGSYRLGFGVATSRYLYGDLLVSGVEQLLRASLRETDFVLGGLSSDRAGNDFMRDVREGTLSAAVIAWMPIAPHPLAYLRPLAHGDAPIPANARYATPELDGLLDEAATTDDAARREAIYTAIARTLLDDYAIAPLWQDTHTLVAWDDIYDVTIEPNGLLRFDLLARE